MVVSNSIIKKTNTGTEIVKNVDWLCRICPAQCKFAFVKEFPTEKLEFYINALQFNFYVFRDLLLEEFPHIELFICAMRGILAHLIEQRTFITSQDKDIISLILQEMVQDTLNESSGKNSRFKPDINQHEKNIAQSSQNAMMNENNGEKTSKNEFVAICSQCNAKLTGKLRDRERDMLKRKGILTKVMLHSDDHALVVTLDSKLKVRRAYTYSADLSPND